jgi:hypothetical protein
MLKSELFIKKGASMRNKIFICAAVVAMMAGSVHSDILMKRKMHTDAMKMMGMTTPAKDEVSTTWIAEGKMCTDNPDAMVILRMDKEIIYTISKKDKKYTEIPMSMLTTAMSNPKMDEVMKGMAGQMKLSITETAETKVINGWNCRKYTQVMTMPMVGPVTSEVWASPDIKVDYELYMKSSAAMYARMPGMANALQDIIKEMKKMKGVPVLTNTTMKMMGAEMKTSDELLEVKEDKAPANVFEVPAGYKKTAMK